MNNDAEEQIQDLRIAMIDTERALTRLLRKLCPGEHEPRQHRDGQPPWCPHCRRDVRGYLH